MPRFEDQSLQAKRSADHSINSEVRALFSSSGSSNSYGTFSINSETASLQNNVGVYDDATPSSSLYGSFPDAFSQPYFDSRKEHFKKAFVEEFKVQIESYVREAKKRKENASKRFSAIYEVFILLVGMAAGFFLQLEGELLTKILYQVCVAIATILGVTFISKIHLWHEYHTLKKSQERAKRISAITYFLRNSEQFEKILEETVNMLFSKFEGKIATVEGYHSGGLDVAMYALAKAAVGRAMNYFDKNADADSFLQQENWDGTALTLLLMRAVLGGKPETKGTIRTRKGDKLYLRRDGKSIEIRAGEFFNGSSSEEVV